MLSLQSDFARSGSNLPPLLGHKKIIAKQRQLSQSPSSLRFDIVSRTYADTDTLALYFTKAKEGVIATTEDIAPGIDADYDDKGKLVSLDIGAASKKTPCHFFDTAEIIDGKYPLAVNWYCSAEDGRLVVLLSMWDVNVVSSIVKTDDPDISLGTDATGKLCAVFVSDASHKTFTIT